MLRLIFVFIVIAVGVVGSFQGPFNILLFFLWNAHFRPEYWVWSAQTILQLRLSLLIGIVLVLACLPRLPQYRFTFRTALVLLFAAQSLLSTLMSEYPVWSMAWWTEFSKVLVIALLIPLVVDTANRYRTAMLVIAYSIAFEAAKQGWAQMVLNPGAQNNNPHPVLGDNNGVGMAMMMLIPIFLSFMHTARSRWETYVHRFFIVGLFYRGVSTYSRGAFLAAGVLGLFVLARSKKRVRGLIAATVVATLAFSLMPDTFWDRMSTITVSDERRDDSSAGRLYFWEVAVDMAQENPIFGVGFNAYSRAFSAYDTSEGFWGDQRAVHSAWFGVLAEMGYPGLVIYVWVLCWTLLACSRIRRHVAAGPPELLELRHYATALQTSLVVFAVGVTFLNGQYNELYWHLVGLSLALDAITARVLARDDALVPQKHAGVAETPLHATAHGSWVPPAVSS